MAVVLLGVLAALCWSLHDVIARNFAARIGPFRMAALVMVAGGVLLAAIVVWRGTIWFASAEGLTYGLVLGLTYGLGTGGLFKAVSLGPISLVGPLTSGYPALVVFWGLAHGLLPTPIQWMAVAATLTGSLVVSRAGPPDGGINSVEPGKLPVLMLFCAIAALGYASSIIIGQNAAVVVGEIEATFLSRFTALVTILPFIMSEPAPRRILRAQWLGILAMASCDVAAVTAVNASGHLPGKQFAAVGVSACGAGAVILATIFLGEKVSPGQWLGIALIAGGVATLSLSQ
ncbi:MAG: DMT family transporter [Alphaproteobacteria bacterium]|nr:DMT family transporter [Alphaproteobacteria bacterium]